MIGLIDRLVCISVRFTLLLVFCLQVFDFVELVVIVLQLLCIACGFGYCDDYLNLI